MIPLPGFSVPPVRRLVLAGALLLALGAWAHAAPSHRADPRPSAGAWVARAALPTPRVWTQCLVLQGRVYVLGGRSGWGRSAQPCQVLETYDPDADRWGRASPPPTADVLTAAVVRDGRILYLQRQPGLLGFEYAPAADQWTPIPGGSADFYSNPHHAAAVHDSRLFGIHSVWADGVPTARLLEYDFSRHQWTERNRPTHAAAGLLMAAGRELYLIGGGPDGREAAAFDVAANSWTRLTDLITGRIEVRCAEWKGGLVAVGGHASRTGETLDAVEVYEPATGTWHALPPLPEPRWGVGVAVCNDRLFVFGGCAGARGDNPASDAVWEFVPAKP